MRGTSLFPTNKDCRKYAFVIPLQRKPRYGTLTDMKRLKALALLMFAASLTLTACGDDDEDDKIYTPEPKGELAFSGQLTTKVCFNQESGNWTDYSNDNTNASFKLEDDGSITIVLDQMTARPATDDIPASMMTGINIKNVAFTPLPDDSYRLSVGTEDFVEIAGGTMNGKFSTYKKGYVTGTFSGKTLKLTIADYKFTPSSYEPLMRSEFTGTLK